MHKLIKEYLDWERREPHEGVDNYVPLSIRPRHERCPVRDERKPSPQD